MSEGFQITIPDLADDDYPSNPVPFGRSGGTQAFGGFGFGSSATSGQDSPTFSAPAPFGGAGSNLGERSQFQYHTRADSVTSEDSANSASNPFGTRQTNAGKTTPFGHTPQSSIPNSTTTGTTITAAFAKKSSFASIRNVFKSGKNNDNAPPPVPSLDQSYPVLRNPFNRSTSSLNQHHATSPTSRAPTMNTSTFGRPSTPGLGSRNIPMRSKSHGYAKPHRSQSGSFYNPSDGAFGHGGSDHGHGFSFSSSPPPMPRIPPNGFAGMQLNGSSATMVNGDMSNEYEEDRVVIDPKTPSDYALHAVFIRFAAEAEAKIDAFLKRTDQEPILTEQMGLGVDKKFDDILLSLAKIAQKHAKSVIDSITRWRRSQNDPVSEDIIHLHRSSHPSLTNNRSHNTSNSITNFASSSHYYSTSSADRDNSRGRNGATSDLPALLNERKSLASMYIMCRALITVLKSIGKDALVEVMWYKLEDVTFEQFVRRPLDAKVLEKSPNHRANAELFAKLVGALANIRFTSVTDRFLSELNHVVTDQVPKDQEGRYEYLVKGLKHIQIKVWPSEAFEEGAEFLEALSKPYLHAHGVKLKSAFADALLHLLHPISKTAQAETNIPQWGRAIEVIFPKAKEMMSKPRYWQVAFPLAITALCVAPQTYFLDHWFSFFSGLLNKLKDKPNRVFIMNGIMRLLWTYLYRCQESMSATTTKLDTILKNFFPPNRLTVFGVDDHLEPFIYLSHFILSRHPEYGKELCLDLMQSAMILQQQSNATSLNPHIRPSYGNIGNILAPERTVIAIQSILLSLSCIEREVMIPSWPTSPDFSKVSPSLWDDYPSSSDFLPPSILSKPSYMDFLDKVSTTLAVIAEHCGNAVGYMSLLDDQWNYARLNPAYEETHNFVVRRRARDGVVVAYPSALASQITLLQACFQAWPRLLLIGSAHGGASGGAGSDSGTTIVTSLQEAVDLLLYGVVHVEELLAESAALALKRFMAVSRDPSSASLASCTTFNSSTPMLLSPAHPHGYANMVMARFHHFLFGPSRLGTQDISKSSGGLRFYVELPSVLGLWVQVVEMYLSGVVLRKPISSPGAGDGPSLAHKAASSPSSSSGILPKAPIGHGVKDKSASAANSAAAVDKDANTSREKEREIEERVILMRCQEIEAAALWLLSFEVKSIKLAGVKVMRILGTVAEHLALPSSPSNSAAGTTMGLPVGSDAGFGASTTSLPTSLGSISTGAGGFGASGVSPAAPSNQYGPMEVHGPLYLTERMHGKGKDPVGCLYGYDELLDSAEVERLEIWRQMAAKNGFSPSSLGPLPLPPHAQYQQHQTQQTPIDIPLRIAESMNEKDRKLWRYVYPALMQSCMDHPGPALGSLREMLVASATKYHSTIAQLAGLKPSGGAGGLGGGVGGGLGAGRDRDRADSYASHYRDPFSQGSSVERRGGGAGIDAGRYGEPGLRDGGAGSGSHVYNGSGGTGGGNGGGYHGSQSPERDGSRLIRENRPLIDQWHIWVKVLSSTATLSETSRPALITTPQLAAGGVIMRGANTTNGDHAQAPSSSFITGSGGDGWTGSNNGSDLNLALATTLAPAPTDASTTANQYIRERFSTTRGLFRSLTPFLDSEYTLFRDTAVLCISSFPPTAYSQLLEDLSLLAGRQFYDDPRGVTGVGMMNVVKLSNIVGLGMGGGGNNGFGSDGQSMIGVGSVGQSAMQLQLGPGGANLRREHSDDNSNSNNNISMPVSAPMPVTMTRTKLNGGLGGGVLGTPSLAGLNGHPSVDRSGRRERLHSAVARIYYLTAHYLQQPQRNGSLAASTNSGGGGLGGRQAALANVLKFVRNTQSFMSTPQMKENHTLQRLRRYFCGTVERLFDRLKTLDDSDRFIPSNMHLTLYRLCEEWCQLGQQSEKVVDRMRVMKHNVVGQTTGPAIGATRGAGGVTAIQREAEAKEALERFEHETMLLSNAAIGAMASLCEKAYFPPEQGSSSPTDKSAAEYSKPLETLQLLDKLCAIMAVDVPANQARGKKAFRSVLTYRHPYIDPLLTEECLRRAVVAEDDLLGSSCHLFEVIAEIVCSNTSHPFTFGQLLCLGLVNLRHPVYIVRRRAFDMLECLHRQQQESLGLQPMSHFEAMVGSLAPGTYVSAHKIISENLASAHPEEATNVLVQLASWFPQLPPTSAPNIVLLSLQSLEFWIHNIDLMTGDKADFTREGLLALFHLMSLTSRYGHTHMEQISVIWSRLVEPPNHANSHATIRFLLEQSHKVGSTSFISCAATVVACLCQTSMGRQVFAELCSLIEPARMLPFMDQRMSRIETDDLGLSESLNELFADQIKLQLGSAQFAWLFLADVALPCSWELNMQLPILLHALVTHVDHKVSYVRHRAQRALFQVLRSWAPGYDELELDQPYNQNRASLKATIDAFEQEAERVYWKDNDTSADLESKMKWFCAKIVDSLEPLSPSLTDRWGSLALSWGTACSIRATAFRSLQIFRALMPRVKQSDLALLLGRLSNTIAAADENIQSFTTEIILTIDALARQEDLDGSLLPQMFWCACACLSTNVENEFLQVVQLVHSLLARIRLDDLDTVELLISHRPLEWKGSGAIQPALLKGLRSSLTSGATMNLLYALTKIQDDGLIDSSVGRLRDLYTLSLPWCLRAMNPDTPQDDRLKTFAQDIGTLASLEGRQSITRIMNSFAKGHFRTRDDFLRQSVASLREHYGAEHWTEIVTLLISIVLNNDRSLRIHTLQILKVLFQQRETRSPVERLGSELLMPMLRLLETDLAQNALEVLEEPMTMSTGGPPAKQVLRMSMHVKLTGLGSDATTVIFGVPKESGWCIAQADVLQETCRSNVIAVFDTCSMPTRPSRIDFEPEIEALAALQNPMMGGRQNTFAERGQQGKTEDFDGLVKDLHDISNFFQDTDTPHVRTPQTPHDRRLEARVAAILAKSTNSDNLAPQTPFLDAFGFHSQQSHGSANGRSTPTPPQRHPPYSQNVLQVSLQQSPPRLSPRPYQHPQPFVHQQQQQRYPHVRHPIHLQHHHQHTDSIDNASDDSEEYSDAESEGDAFVFDSPSIYRPSAPNGNAAARYF